MVCTGNVTIFARWRLMKYKITLVANGGSVSPSYKMVDYCIAYGELPTPTWSGHTFDGWWTAKIGGSQVTASTKCIGNATIYAHWKMNQYKLTFAANGGTVSPASKMLDYCATCDSFPTPTWGGHTFNGWFTARSGGTKVTAPWKCTGNKTIYAQWTPKQYKVTFNANGGTVTPAYKVVGYCSVYGDLPTPVKSGYTFGGWWTAKVNGTRVTSNTKCAGSATIYAHWEKKQYKLTFDANGGTVSPAYKMVEYCKTCDTFPTPTRGGYTFNGWFTARSGGTKVMAPWKCTGNKTIYAQWTPKQYKLTFDANGGTVSSAYEMVEYCKTCDAFPTPTRGGHTFKGWFTARSGGTKVTAPWKCTGNKTIYAQWTPKQYKVTFNANGGVVSSTYKMVNYCETYGTLPQPTRGGHSFDGWWTKQTGGSLVSSATKCTGNATIYAHWKVKQYKLTFNANGGAVSPTYRMVDYCATYGTLPQPTWGGHTFKGWYTSKTGGTLVSSATKCTGGATIYARWALNQYKLTFNANGGTVSPGYKMVNYCVTYGTLPQPTWSGHTFKGWYTSKAGGSPVSSATKCTGNATIYARWALNQYRLTFNANGGTVSPAYQAVNYCETCRGELPKPSWGGHEFLGWYTAKTNGERFEFPWKCTGNKTIYARWKVKQYKVTFNANDGTVSPTYRMVDYCATYGSLPTPMRGGHDFKGWWTAASGGSPVSAATVCTGNATIYARWSLKQYALTFNANGGTVSPAYQMVKYCKTYGTLPKPVWSGRTFDGWWTKQTGGTQVTPETVCTGNATVYAHWTTAITPSFTSGGNAAWSQQSDGSWKSGKIGNSQESWIEATVSGPGTISFTYDTSSEAGADVLTFYIDGKEQMNVSGGNGKMDWTPRSFSVSGSGSHTLRWSYRKNGSASAGMDCAWIKDCSWEVKQYKVTFDANGGSVSPAYRMVGYCKTYGTLPTPTWTGRTFGGWWTAASGGTQVSAETKCTGSTTVYARWTLNTYTIHFDANGGKGTMSNLSMLYGTKKNLTANAFTRQGYYFVGWALSVNGGKAYSDKAAVSNLTETKNATVTLYAVWRSWPTNVKASDGTSTENVVITWTAAAGATSYQIWRGTSEDAATAELVGTSDTTTYSDAEAIPGTPYYYAVSAVVNNQSSLRSTPEMGWRVLSKPIYTGYYEDVKWTSVGSSYGPGIREVIGTHYYYSLPAGATGFEVAETYSGMPTADTSITPYYNTSALDYYWKANVINSKPYRYVRAVNDFCKSEWLLIQR